MSLRLFDDLFFRPVQRHRLFPSPHMDPSPHFQLWPSLRLSEEDNIFDDFVRGVDDRFSGILANVHYQHRPRGVSMEQELGSGEGTSQHPNKFEMKLAVQDFRPDDIKVKVHGSNLIVEAKREEKREAEGMYAHSYREFKRSFPIPEEVDKKKLSSALSSGGILEIEAPLLAAIEHQKREGKKQIEVTYMEE